jgi:hypothetical protein
VFLFLRDGWRHVMCWLSEVSKNPITTSVVIMKQFSTVRKYVIYKSSRHNNQCLKTYLFNPVKLKY